MIDNYKRKIDYIRISVTDRCNLRCFYCMPKEGVKPLKHVDILTFDEIVRLCRCFAEFGVNKIKLTGGEPLVRKNLVGLVRSIKDIEGIKNVTLTTNGVLLKEQLPDLIEAGLDAINISLDTLNPEIYAKITGSPVLQEVLDGIKQALTYEKLNVKVNCLPIPGVNEDDILKIAELAKDTRVNVRFIEMMPIGLGKNYSYYNEDNIVNKIELVYGPLIKLEEKLGNGPAHYYSVPGFVGKVGFISAMSHQFCEECNRIRLTSDGFLKTCLQYAEGADLKSILRETKEDEYLKQVIYQTIFSKPQSHHFNDYSNNSSSGNNNNVDVNKHLIQNEDIENKETVSSKEHIHYEEKRMNTIGG